jgi:hypothetical protein
MQQEQIEHAHDVDWTILSAELDRANRSFLWGDSYVAEGSVCSAKGRMADAVAHAP